jgi:hypothetical protein
VWTNGVTELSRAFRELNIDEGEEYKEEKEYKGRKIAVE